MQKQPLKKIGRGRKTNQDILKGWNVDETNLDTPNFNRWMRDMRKVGIGVKKGPHMRRNAWRKKGEGRPTIDESGDPDTELPTLSSSKIKSQPGNRMWESRRLQKGEIACSGR